MNESDFEKELRFLRPSSPSAGLAERIAAELSQAVAIEPSPRQPAAGVLSRPAKDNRWLGWRSLILPFAAVAAIVVFLVVNGTHRGAKTVAVSSTPASAAALSENPDESVAELIATEDEGLVYGENDEPQRQVKMVYLERHTWTNPQTGAVIEFEVPREDIVLMPVAMQ